MAREENDDKLTEADRIIMRLYDEAKEPIDWDVSDDAILSYSREIHAKDGAGRAAAAASDADSARQDGGEQGASNVISFADRRRSFVNRIVHSQAVGFSLAASLMIGVFTGQAMIRYVDLGISPGYEEVVRDNVRLQEELSKSRNLLTRSLKSSGGEAPPTGDSLFQLTQAISGFDCASVSATLSKELEITVSGYVGSEADLRRLTGKLSAFDRLANVVNRTTVRAWPICEVLDILPQKASLGQDSRLLPKVQPLAHGPDFVENEKLVVEAQATSKYDGFLYVDFIQHDGSVLHMFPGRGATNNAVRAGQRMLLGNGKQAYTIAPPYGTEMLVVLSSPAPLFDTPRPQSEKAEDYFAALRTALGRADTQGFVGDVVSNYYFITTGPDQAGSRMEK